MYRGRFQDFSYMGTAAWDKIKRDDLFFEPQEEEILLKEKDTGWHIIYRKPDSFISIRSKNYELVKNAELNRIIRDYRQVTFTLNRRLCGSRDNRKFSLVYDVDIKELWDEDARQSLLVELGLEPRFVALNTYDGASSLRFQFGFFRLISSNFLIIPVKGKVIRKAIRHKKGNFFPDLKTQVEKFLNSVSMKIIFEMLIEKILNAKNTKFLSLPFQFFVNLPGDLVYLFLATITAHANFPVEVDVDQDHRFSDITDRETADALLEMILEVRKKKFGLKGSAHPNWALFNFLLSLKLPKDETADNVWELYLLLVRALQIHISSRHRRLKWTIYLGRHLL